MRGDCCVELEDGEDDVCGERADDCDFVLEVVCIAFFFGSAPVVVDGFEEALDVFVLGRVEFLEFLRGARFRVQADGAAAIALARRVGADQGELGFGLDGGRQPVRICVRRVGGRRLRFYVGGTG